MHHCAISAADSLRFAAGRAVTADSGSAVLCYAA